MPDFHLILIWFVVILLISVTVKTFKKKSSFLANSIYKGFCTIFFLTLTFPNAGINKQFREVRSGFTDEIEMLLSLEDDALLLEIQKATFRYFWDFAHPISGMIRERNTSGQLVTTGGSGFGIMAILVGIQNEFITYEDGLSRLEKIVSFLESADRFHGAWPHWMDGSTGKVIPFSERDDGGDLVETAFMIQGLLTAREFFSSQAEREVALRGSITHLWETVDWNWYRKSVQKELYWHWSPNFGWDINLPIHGWNETMITYILAIASPTHSIPPALYHDGWANRQYENGQTYYGYKLEVGRETGGPLFFTHYSFMGLDPRGKRDAYANYFFQGVNQTHINRAYCIENPKNFAGYNENGWGLTASDDPFGYSAHGPVENRDNGTITPSAAISSIIYTPEESLAAIRHFLFTYGDKVWGAMGFFDAFNVSHNWYATSYIAIDQGPIICMIENYRTQFLWNLFMQNEEILRALELTGFVDDHSTVSRHEYSQRKDFLIFPNPTDEHLFLEWESPTMTEGIWEIRTETGIKFQSGEIPANRKDFTITLEKNIPTGLCYLKTEIDDNVTVKKVILIR